MFEEQLPDEGEIENRLPEPYFGEHHTGQAQGDDAQEPDGGSFDGVPDLLVDAVQGSRTAAARACRPYYVVGMGSYSSALLVKFRRHRAHPCCIDFRRTIAFTPYHAADG